MRNNYEHLSNGLTVIFCTNTKLDTEEEVYIDTQMFNYITAFNVEWKVWDDSRGKGKNVPKIVGGIDLDHDDNKILFLRRLIGEYLYGDSYHYSLLNENFYDLRRMNIFKFKPGTGHSGKVRAERAKLLDKLSKLEKKNDINISASNVNVIEYEDKLLIIEESAVVNKITYDQANAISNFLDTYK
jgi:hypothetical protein